MSIRLPPLPEASHTTPVKFGCDGVWYTSDQMREYAADEITSLRTERDQLRQYLDAAQRRGEELRAQVAALEVEVREISGGAGVYMSLLMDCIAVLHTIDPDDSDEAEKLRDLLDAIDRALEPTRHKGALL